ncbi:hypothetical protein IGI65_000578 [Enterococcus sp. DIV0755b]|uniref:hypothetical protein n=1 Tax=Enterococcus sp. DIV0755b TaxID=2774657 RepID=UPI003F229B00
MKKRFLKIQFVFGLYISIYLAALYFSTGYGVGFKLDDNQLIGYILCGISFLLLFLSFFIKESKNKKQFALLFAVFCAALLLGALFTVNFNEAFWYFIFFIFFIPISVIGNVIGFLLKK